MANNADTGNGAQMTLGTSAWTGRLTRINLGEQTREALANDDLLTVGFMKKAEGDLIDAGNIEVDYIFRSDQDLPPFSSPETITITLPLFPGKTTPATVAGTGFLASRKPPELINNQTQAGAATWTWDGETGPVYTKAT